MTLNCNETRGLGPLQVFDAVLEGSAKQARFNRERRGPEVENPGIMVRRYLDSGPRVKKVVDWFTQHTSLESAISDATLSMDWEGKRFSHQHRLKKAILESAKKKLLSIASKLRACTTFEELHDLIGNALKSVDGAGELYVYDVSLRIGSKLELFPRKVFLHAGTRQGARALGLNGQMSWVEMDALPEWLRQLQPYQS